MKTPSTPLKAFADGTRVGLLERLRDGRMKFTYASSYLADPEAVPISLSLPLREEPFADERPLTWFDNLLPDNPLVRERIARATGAPDASVFSLLTSTGRDCAGMMQLVGEDEPDPVPGPARGRVVTDSEVASTLRELPTRPLGVSAGGLRISIAGAQDKTAFLRRKDRWEIPEGSTPTSHLFKPAIGPVPGGVDLTDSVENEWLCLRLAAAFGLPVAEAEISRFENLTCLVVTRFDRAWSTDGLRLKRLWQEDACQAMGVPPARKYEADGGPGVPGLLRLLDASDARDADRSQLMRTLIVFHLLAAIDGHAKNFSIFLSRKGCRLTPVYDVLSVWPALRRRQLPLKQARMAMSVGASRHYDLKLIGWRHWEETARLGGFDRRELHRIRDDLRARIVTLQRSPLALPADFPARLYEDVLSGVTDQARRLWDVAETV